MHHEEKLKLRSHNTSYSIIEVITKTCLTVFVKFCDYWNVIYNMYSAELFFYLTSHFCKCGLIRVIFYQRKYSKLVTNTLRNVSFIT